MFAMISDSPKSAEPTVTFPLEPPPPPDEEDELLSSPPHEAVRSTTTADATPSRTPRRARAVRMVRNRLLCPGRPSDRVSGRGSPLIAPANHAALTITRHNRISPGPADRRPARASARPGGRSGPGQAVHPDGL